MQSTGQPRPLGRRRPYWHDELFLAEDEAWPHRRRLSGHLGNTEVSVDRRFALVVLAYVLLTILVAVVGGSPFWTAVLIGNGTGLVVLVLHEIGHATATRLQGYSVRWLALSAPSAAAGNFALGERYSPKTLAIVAGAGPAVNLISAAVLLIAWFLAHGHVADAFLTAALINGVGGLNLWPGRATLPAGDRKVLTDGGLILRALRAARTGVVEANC